MIEMLSIFAFFTLKSHDQLNILIGIGANFIPAHVISSGIVLILSIYMLLRARDICYFFALAE